MDVRLGSAERNFSRVCKPFLKRCLRRLFKPFRPETTSNERLRQMAQEKAIMPQIKDRKWQRIGQALRKDPQTGERQALNWNPQGRRKRGRPEENV
jgi:hypothetical protein